MQQIKYNELVDFKRALDEFKPIEHLSGLCKVMSEGDICTFPLLLLTGIYVLSLPLFFLSTRGMGI